MTTCLLIRHGQSQANTDGILAGHIDSPLTEEGIAQARQVARNLEPIQLRQVVTSPLDRCRTTAEEVTAAQPDGGPAVVDERFVEVRYGAWTGGLLKDLAKDPLWATIQSTPTAVTFPAHPEHEHEAMTAMADRAWTAWSEWEARIVEEHGDRAVWAIVSHGDVIKALLARALGLELDAFQSIVVDPASVSIVHRHQDRTAVSGLNLRDDVYARLARIGTDDGAGNGESRAGVVGGGDA